MSDQVTVLMVSWKWQRYARGTCCFAKCHPCTSPSWVFQLSHDAVDANCHRGLQRANQWNYEINLGPMLNRLPNFTVRVNSKWQLCHYLLINIRSSGTVLNEPRSCLPVSRYDLTRDIDTILINIVSKFNRISSPRVFRFACSYFIDPLSLWTDFCPSPKRITDK